MQAKKSPGKARSRDRKKEAVGRQGNVQHRTLNIQYPTGEVQQRTSEVVGGRRLPGAQAETRTLKGPGRAAAWKKVLEGMQAGEVEALLGFLGAEESAEDFEAVDAGRFNHAVLQFIEQVTAVLHLRPHEVETLTGLHHQHLAKLRTVGREMKQDVHVSLCTLVIFCNGLHIRLRCAVAWIMQRL